MHKTNLTSQSGRKPESIDMWKDTVWRRSVLSKCISVSVFCLIHKWPTYVNAHFKKYTIFAAVKNIFN